MHKPESIFNNCVKSFRISNKINKHQVNYFGMEAADDMLMLADPSERLDSIERTEPMSDSVSRNLSPVCGSTCHSIGTARGPGEGDP